LNYSTVMRSGAQGIVLSSGSRGSITNGSTIAGNQGDGVMCYIGTILVLHGNVISGNSNFALWCGDSESTFMAMAPLDTTDPIECTGFNH